MRRSTKTLISLIGTAVVVLGGVVNYTSADKVDAWIGPDGKYWSSSVEYYDSIYGIEKDTITSIVEQTVEVDSSPSQKEIQREIQQERMTAQAAAERQALVDEGSKPEHITVVNSDGSKAFSKLYGLYLIKDIKGISYSPAIINEDLNYARLHCVAYETNASKSPAAIAVVNEVAKSVDAVVGPSVNFQYEKYKDGNLVKSSDAAEGTMKMGLDPSFAGEGDKVAVVAVYPGGATKILEDTDDDPATVSVNVPATDSSLVMYSIIKYN
ncbi:MAG: hypothetical protein K5669_12465 [Lachnospiraceae bacterium]|nr:hypothetical protein [Lachnospiraceae bacterium]